MIENSCSVLKLNTSMALSNLLYRNGIETVGQLLALDNEDIARLHRSNQRRKPLPLGMGRSRPPFFLLYF